MNTSVHRLTVAAIITAATLLLVHSSTVTAEVPSPSPSTQFPAPPLLGAIRFENSLQADSPNALPRSQSPSGLVIAEPVGEGYLVKVRGKTADDGATRATVMLDDVNLRDGEMRVEAKVVTGLDRARIVLIVRGQSTANGIPADNAYWAYFGPKGQSAILLKRLEGHDPIVSTIANTSAIRSLRPDDWNAYAVRLQGRSMWLLVNDEPVLYAEDMALANGETMLMLIRTGDPESRDETAAVFRNLRIADLAE